MKATGYDLSRAFWDFAFANPDKVKPVHIGIYFFSIEHCNRMGWKEKFGLPTSMVLEAIGVKSYSVFKKCFDELVSWGFYTVIQYSKNQYSSNIVALKENNKAKLKALDKAMIKHNTKQSESIIESTVSIDKQGTIKPDNQELKIPSFPDFLSYAKTLKPYKPELDYAIEAKYNSWLENDWKDGFDAEIKNWKTKLQNTIHRLEPLKEGKKQTTVIYGGKN